MAEQDFQDEAPKRKGRGILVFVIGLVVGIVAAFVAQPFLGDRLPEAVGGKRESVSGPVAAKQLDGDRLLLTVVTPAGAILGTFKKKVEEINLLVEVGDTVELTIPGYEPFLEDPQITRVGKPLAGMQSLKEGPAVTEEPRDTVAEPADSMESADSTDNGQTSRWYDD